MRVIFTVSLFLATATYALAASDWKQFVYPEYNLMFDFPRHIFLPNTANQQNGTVTFLTDDRRAALAVTGVERRANETPESVLNRIGATAPARFTYLRVTKDFFAASGFWQDLIFYRRCNFADGNNRGACFEVVYPKAEKRKWDSVVTRMSRSLQITKKD